MTMLHNEAQCAPVAEVMRPFCNVRLCPMRQTNLFAGRLGLDRGRNKRIKERPVLAPGNMPNVISQDRSTGQTTLIL